MLEIQCQIQMSISAYTNALCLTRSLTWDALHDTRPHPRRIVVVIFSTGILSTFYFGVKSIPWALLACFLFSELLFRSFIIAYIVSYLYIKSL